MPFRRLRRRHTVIGQTPGSFGVRGDDDPVANMKKGKEEEESAAMRTMTSYLLSYCLHLLNTLIEVILSLVFYASSAEPPQNEEETNENEGKVEEDVATSSDAAIRQRYKKVVMTTSIVDIFNNHRVERAEEDTFMELLEEKQNVKVNNKKKNPDFLDTKYHRSQSVELDLRRVLYSDSSGTK